MINISFYFVIIQYNDWRIDVVEICGRRKKIPKMSNISTDHDHHNYENDFAFLKSKFIIHCDE